MNVSRCRQLIFISRFKGSTRGYKHMWSWFSNSFSIFLHTVKPLQWALRRTASHITVEETSTHSSSVTSSCLTSRPGCVDVFAPPCVIPHFPPFVFCFLGCFLLKFTAAVTWELILHLKCLCLNKETRTLCSIIIIMIYLSYVFYIYFVFAADINLIYHNRLEVLCGF